MKAGRVIMRRFTVGTMLGALLAMVALGFAGTARDIAIILKTSGKVEVGGAGERGWKPGVRGSRLNSGHRIRTGENSLATLIFTDDKSLLKIRSGTELSLEGERQGSSVSKRLTVDAGELWAKISKGGGGYRLETPSGVAAVKGTEFYLLVAEDGSATAVVLEGIVELMNSLGTALVGSGQTGTMRRGEPPGTLPSQEVPDWGGEAVGVIEQEGMLRIEFQDESGAKRYLVIKYMPR